MFDVRENRTEKVTVRFTKEEKTLMEQYAFARNLKLSDFIRYSVEKEINGSNKASK